MSDTKYTYNSKDHDIKEKRERKERPIDEALPIRKGSEVFNKATLDRFTVKDIIYSPCGMLIAALILDYPGPNGGYVKVLPNGYILYDENRFEQRATRQEKEKKYLERNKRRKDERYRYGSN